MFVPPFGSCSLVSVVISQVLVKSVHPINRTEGAGKGHGRQKARDCKGKGAKINHKGKQQQSNHKGDPKHNTDNNDDR